MPLAALQRYLFRLQGENDSRSAAGVVAVVQPRANKTYVADHACVVQHCMCISRYGVA
jgi:hypothetical protein